MSYEYARMSEPDSRRAALLLLFAGSFGAVLFSSWNHLGPAVGWMGAFALISAMRRRTLRGIIETAGGALYVGLPAAVFLWLRERGPEGRETILALFAIIWAADIFAYFGGKLIGGPKIALGLSPNKTWAGIVAGIIAGALAGYVCGVFFAGSSEISVLWVSTGALVGFTGLMGDLFESFLKRRFGVKDASQLIPGHGGVLDRIDSLMAASLLAGAVLALAPGLANQMFGGAP